MSTNVILIQFSPFNDLVIYFSDIRFSIISYPCLGYPSDCFRTPERSLRIFIYQSYLQEEAG